MWTSERQQALERMRFLMERDINIQAVLGEERGRNLAKSTPTRGLHLLLYQANLDVPVLALVLLCGFSGVLVGWLSALVLTPPMVPLFALGGACIPYLLVEARVTNRAHEFACDYPTVLLATASSIKVGLTPYLALERSIRLLPRESLVRQEVEKLVGALRRGISKEDAIAAFGARIRQPDLALFRAAFLLVMENGGRFAPTLGRLATVSKDRSVLVSSARVSTATMRMTANVLLAIAPILVVVISVRTENFWQLFVHHPVANFVASAGITIITVSYAVLRRMSAFKP